MDILTKSIEAAIKAVPGVWPYLSLHARLLSRKAGRDKRTWQGQAEKELQTKINGLMLQYWKLTAKNIANGKPPMTQEFANKLQSLISTELAYIAKDNAEEEAANLGIAFDPAAVDVAAEAWAKDYSYDLIKGIDEKTRDLVSGAITDFTNTPGMTNQDIFDRLSSAFGDTRAEMIAITEVTRAFSAGEQIYQNMLTDMGVTTVREWLTSEDEKVCPICGYLDGQQVAPGEKFKDGEGNEYDNPPAHVNCILPGNEVIAPDILAMSRVLYDGGAIDITFESGRVISVTQNHPILTPAGWVKACFLNEGMYALASVDTQRIASSINPYKNHIPAKIDKIFGSIMENTFVIPRRMKAPAENFYGDAKFFNSDIDVIDMNGLLLNNFIAISQKPTGKKNFSGGNANGIFFNTLRMVNFLFDGSFSPLRSGMSSGHLSDSFFCGHKRPFHRFALGLVARSDSAFNQAIFNNTPVHTNLSRKFIDRFARNITLDKIVKIRNYHFSGHVYDLQTKMYELYICNGIIVKNCRCGSQVRVP